MALSLNVNAGEVPDVIKKGLEALKNSGPKDAATEWLKGSFRENDKQAIMYASSYQQIIDIFGKYVDYDFVREFELSPRSKVYMLGLNHENGIAFACIQTYKKHDGKVVSIAHNFYTDYRKALQECRSLE